MAVRGTGLSELRRIVTWLPQTDAEPLLKLLERLESGRIEQIQAGGAARFAQWRRLVQGELQSLPAGFVLTTDVAGIPDLVSEDVVAQQLREAAQAEKDPELRDRLWQEYRDYNNL